jgi:hypothetical protein
MMSSRRWLTGKSSGKSMVRGVDKETTFQTKLGKNSRTCVTMTREDLELSQSLSKVFFID